MPSDSKKISTGRGGAGNMPKVNIAAGAGEKGKTSERAGSSSPGPASPAPAAVGKRGVSATRGSGANSPAVSSEEKAFFVTPTIKERQYTTGRGGSGNIVSNDDPELARRAQDVDAPPVRRDFRGGEAWHHGRGGEGNMVIARESKGKERASPAPAPATGPSNPSTAPDALPDAIRDGARKKERRGSGLAEKGREIIGRLTSGDRQRRSSGTANRPTNLTS